ncbi:MAG: phosphatase [Bacteroidetes bacterium]|nr:phosphatase [Bacteroidota bacterium]
MPIALIDIGTNTFNLLVAELRENGSFNKIYKTRVPVGMGRGGIMKNHIQEEAFRLGIETLAEYKRTADKYGAGRIIAYATAAVRDADNGNDFAGEALRQTGISITVIDGNREAELIWSGIREAVPLKKEPVLIMDIGGGSAEFIIAGREKIFWKKSFRLGVIRILEAFRPSDPLLADDILKIENFFMTELSPLFIAAKYNPVKILVGSAGSFETMADLIEWHVHKKTFMRSNKSCKLKQIDFLKIYGWLVQSTLKERLDNKVIPVFRADTIHLAAILIHTVLKNIPVSKIWVSAYSLREGMLFENRSPFKLPDR